MSSSPSVMYTGHFGLTEAPFSITPDPQYLFMSERHREALAHLFYGVGERGGFVQLTGEVGTGKTTVCRCLLTGLPSEVDVALILNPRLTAIELLATICDELRIPYQAAPTSLKPLVDALYRYLLDAHMRDRRTVLIVDEAQNLPAEVLEQVRLLTNLETPKQKLLHIILIGQPELINLLNQANLRQLAQRVTARYHLLPLSSDETRAYVRHRLEVAGVKKVIFSEAALQSIYKLSRGIPRVVNVICERALLGAYTENRTRIDVPIVRKAAAEVLGEPASVRYRRVARWIGAVAGAFAMGLAAWLSLPPQGIGRTVGISARSALSPASVRKSEERSEPTVALVAREPGTPEAGTGPATQEKKSRAAPVPEQLGPARLDAEIFMLDERGPADGDGPPGGALARFLSDPTVDTDRSSAFLNLFARWGLDANGVNGQAGCEQASREGLRCLVRHGTWDTLRRFNLPAVIEMVAPTGESRYAMVAALGRRRATLVFGRKQLTLQFGDIDPVWSGAFTLLWRPPLESARSIAPGMRSEGVAWLRQQLSVVDGGPANGIDRHLYDSELKRRVVAFQRSRSLSPDGIVGEETLTHLSTIVFASSTPALSSLNW